MDRLASMELIYHSRETENILSKVCCLMKTDKNNIYNKALKLIQNIEHLEKEISHLERKIDEVKNG